MLGKTFIKYFVPLVVAIPFLLFSVPAAQAGGGVQPPPTFNGPYVGIQGGVDLAVFDAQFTIFNPLFFISNANIGHTGFVGGISIGYGHLWHQFYIAAELQGLLDSVRAVRFDSDACIFPMTSRIS